MTATVVRLKPNSQKIECSECGAIGTASCDCGAPYVRAGTRAQKAVAKYPEKSDRAIAAMIGVNRDTVGRARKKAGVANQTREKRVGKDGKTYKFTKNSRKAAKKKNDGGCNYNPAQTSFEDEAREVTRRRALLFIANDTIEQIGIFRDQLIGAASSEITEEIIVAVLRAAEAWHNLSEEIAARKVPSNGKDKASSAYQAPVLGCD